MERAYEKYSWVILLAVGLVFLVFALMYVFLPATVAEMDYEFYTDMSWGELETSRPAVADFLIALERADAGYHVLGVAVFVTAISLTSYRRGERWAWYAMWYVPIRFLLLVVEYIPRPEAPGMILYPTILIVSLLGLLLPYRKFFPR